MSRQEFNLTVNTGGEEGQILDHLLCARDPNVRHRDAKDLLKLVGNLRSRIAELDAERDRLRRLAEFGQACLRAWWDDGDPGDMDGGAVQEDAEAAGLWQRVERHSDGVECEWCNGAEPCGELTDAGLAALKGRKP